MEEDRQGSASREGRTQVNQYWPWLIAISAVFIVTERIRPRRPGQRLLRAGWITDLLYLGLYGHFFGLGLAKLTVHTARWFTDAVDAVGVGRVLDASVASGWPLWVQVLLVFVGLDFVRWGVHNLLHRVPWLWEFHKIHHGIRELDWAGSFHFHWVEILVYKTALYLPLVVMGFDARVLFASALFSTFMGHFNHANLDVDIGPLKYFFNNPRMHEWHHDRDEVPMPGANFAIDLSVWDWLFGTVWMPGDDRMPGRLGFDGIEEIRDGFLPQLGWPAFRRNRGPRI